MQHSEIDLSYDPELRVGSRTPFIDWYVSRSLRARSELKSVLDVPFGQTTAETLDIFPARKTASPVMAFIHGGYWRALSSREFSFVARGLVAHDITVVVTNYALCPQVSIAEITRQTSSAVAWIVAHAHEFNGDPRRVFVAGHSAGGQQVGMLLSAGPKQLPDQTANLVKGGIAISGIFDVRPLQLSWLQSTLQLTDELAAEQSPLLHVPRTAPPLMLSVGGAESPAFLQQSENLRAAWTSAGLDARMFEQPGLNHFEAIYGFDDQYSRLTRAVVDFIRA